MVPSAVRAAATAALLLAPLAAQAVDQRTAAVGMRARVEQVVLPGGELVPAPATLAAPVVVRVLATWPHGEHLRYDLEWVALEAGRHDLTKFLARKDGSATDGLPPLLVEATSTLPKGVNEPADIAPQAPVRLDGYRTLQIVAAVAWGVGLLAILFVGRRFRRKVATVAAAPTLADRLRPLVDAVARGAADTGAKAELERLLVAFWRERLGLRDATAADAIVAIKAHPEAGELLRAVEAWLHRPEPPPAGDLHRLLEPYRHVAADAAGKGARAATTPVAPGSR
jgi:hypothetical protein